MIRPLPPLPSPLREHLDVYRQEIYAPPFYAPAKPEGRPLLTVCIAVACDCFLHGTTQEEKTTPRVILVADRMLSMEITSTETGLKIWRLIKGFYLMFAGQDVTPVLSLAKKAKLSVDGGLSVEQPLETAYQQVRLQEIQARITKRFGWTLEEFWKQGRESLPDGYYQSVVHAIDTFDLQCEFLGAGFTSDKAGFPLIFTVKILAKSLLAK